MAVTLHVLGRDGEYGPARDFHLPDRYPSHERALAMLRRCHGKRAVFTVGDTCVSVLDPAFAGPAHYRIVPCGKA